jgi:hypothetical protein
MPPMGLGWPRMLDFARRAPRNADFGELQETFLIAGVATILVIRTQLWATNYPQLGGHGLHIAHLLYGGVFMVVAIWILITLLGRLPRRPAAVIGGIGFGFFIDELGKFVTADNNYFFRPAAGMIYLVFIALFLLNRAMQRRRALTSSERITNALDLVAEAARRHFDEHEKRRALDLLRGVDPHDPMVEPVRHLVQGVDAIPARAPGRIARFASAVRERYFRLAARPWFQPAVGWLFALWALVSIWEVLVLVLSLGLHVGGAQHGFGNDQFRHLSVINIASLVSSAVSAAFVVAGQWKLRAGSRLEAYRLFDRALLVAIFVTQFFSFVESQFGAVFGLGVDLVLLGLLRYVTRQEQRRLRPAPDLAPAGEPRPQAAVAS